MKIEKGSKFNLKMAQISKQGMTAQVSDQSTNDLLELRLVNPRAKAKPSTVVYGEEIGEVKGRERKWERVGVHKKKKERNSLKFKREKGRELVVGCCCVACYFFTMLHCVCV